jgi:hypothetical protein
MSVILFFVCQQNDFSLLPRREESPLPLCFRGFASLQARDEGGYVKIVDLAIILDFAIALRSNHSDWLYLVEML